MRILVLLQIMLCIFSAISTGSDDNALNRIHQALQTSDATAISPLKIQGNDLKVKSVDALTIENCGSMGNPASVRMGDKFDLRYKITAHTDGGDIPDTYIPGTYSIEKPFTLYARLGIYSTIDGHLVQPVVEKEVRSNYAWSLSYISDQVETIPIYIDPNLYNEGIYHNQGVYDPAVYRVNLEIYAAKMKDDEAYTSLGSLKKGELIRRIGNEIGYFKVDTEEGINRERDCRSSGNVWQDGKCIPQTPQPPEAQFCESHTGKYQNGQCTFQDGSSCNAVAFQNGQCLSASAQNALNEALNKVNCISQGGTYQNGQCVQQTPEQRCYAQGNVYWNGQCLTPQQFKEQLAQQAQQQCAAQGGIYQNGQCVQQTPQQQCAATNGVYDSSNGKCYSQAEWQAIQQAIEQTKQDVERLKQWAQKMRECQQSGGTWIDQGNYNGYCQPAPSPEVLPPANNGTMYI
jgi:hypothetical protein